jgi:pimeloyl-ACP methyl ester carboxylesterase
MPFLEAAGQRLEYAWHGPPPDAGPVLVFLHEGLGCVAMWKDFPSRLAAATGLGALVYSRRGYGASDPIPGPRPISYMHDEAQVVLPAVLDAARVRDAILVGHSDGGSIALIHAGAVGGRRVRALILEAAHVLVEDVSVQSIAAAAGAYRSTRLRDSLARYHGANVDGAFWGWNDVWLDPAFRDWNIEAHLPGVACPCLAIQGADDEYGTAEQVRRIADGVAGPVEALMLADCGHAPHRDQPEETLAAMARFVGSLADA